MTKLTPMKAIRLKCLDCCCDSIKEIRECPIEDCPLHSYRMGKNPKLAGRKGNVEALQAWRKNQTTKAATQG